MAFGDTPHDEALRSAWHRFCDELREAGDGIFRDPIRATPEIRAESIRYLTQAMSQGVDWHIENQMPHHPFLMRMFGPTRKQAGDKSMSMDYGAYIDGSQDYRIFGHRGTSKWITASVLRRPEPGAEPVVSGPNKPRGRDWNEPWALVVDGPGLLNPDVEIAADGTFELWVGPTPRDGNWLATTPAACHVRIRQLFDDWETEEPMSLRIERVGGEPGTTVPPPLLHPEQMVDMLAEAGRFVTKSISAWGPPATKLAPDNTFAIRPRNDPKAGEIDANPGGVMGICWWSLDHDQAMIIDFRPVADYFWCWELENVWWATPDYRWRLVTLTTSQAVAEPDGRVVIVVSGVDPGVPNWLDTAGYLEGFVRFRSLLPIDDLEPAITTRVVGVGDLEAELSEVTRIDAAGRREQLRSRAAGVDRRFRI